MDIERLQTIVADIPEDDIPLLHEMGVATVFTPGATTQSIVEWVRTNVGGSTAA